VSEGDIAQRVTPVDSTLPTGVVTFLFSDVEGSTQMLEAHRAAAGTALAHHHELLLAVDDSLTKIAGWLSAD